MSNPSRVFFTGALLALMALAVGCGRHLQQSLGGLGNQRPVVQLESAFTPAGDPQALGARLTWRATDPDGRIDHYLVTEDIGAWERESGWTATGASERSLGWRRAERGAARPAAEPPYRFFAVRAVDDQGAVSDAAYRVFFDENVAPTVTIVAPHPSPLLSPSVPSDVTIRWAGSDPDGPNGLPAKYKFKLYKFGPSIPWSKWIVFPDSFRAEVAPAFIGWDSLPGDSTQVSFSGLIPNSEYLFAITAIDAGGAYDPVFSLSKNMLRLYVGMPNSMGPRLTFFNSSFTYRYLAGGWPDPIPGNWIVPVRAPAGKPLTLNWSAEPMVVTELAGYRWALDLADPHDQTVRRNRNDVRHWSAWDLASTSVTIDEPMLAKLPVADAHRLYVEALDNVGWKSIGVVEFRFDPPPAFDRDLLIVKDTRLRPGQLAPGSPDSLRAPSGRWPDAAELDTFLFAVGGVRWRMTPSGTISPPGIFHGYAFDTLGTRGRGENPTIPIELLQHYRHVVWIVDLASANMVGSPISLATPVTTLRYMCRANQQNTLAAWVAAGGELWAVGGGFGHATNADWNRGNDTGPARTYSSLGAQPDLLPGRFMYDLVHWRREFQVLSHQGMLAMQRAPGADGMLPPTMRSKQGLDPIAPLRTAGDFYGTLTPHGFEYLVRPNVVVDDTVPSPRVAHTVPVLDTLMILTDAAAPRPDPSGPIALPVMTRYHGAECGPVTFTGFDLWSWARTDCARLVDAVLQGQWGLVREAPMARATSPTGGGTIRR